MKVETEYKLELSEGEFIAIKNQLVSDGYDAKECFLEDYFFNVESFDEKGWNFTRVRIFNHTRCEEDTKIWKIVNGEKIREERSRPLSFQKLASLINQGHDRLHMNKYRIDFTGEFLNYSGVISLDKVVLGKKIRYFVELEVDVPVKKSHLIRKKIRDYLLKTFSLSDREEGFSMMALLLDKSDRM